MSDRSTGYRVRRSRTEHHRLWLVLATVFAVAGVANVALAVSSEMLWPVLVAVGILVVSGACVKGAVGPEG